MELSQAEIEFIKDLIQAVGGTYRSHLGQSFGSALSILVNAPTPEPTTIASFDDRWAALAQHEELKREVDDLKEQVSNLRLQLDRANPDWGRF